MSSFLSTPPPLLQRHSSGVENFQYTFSRKTTARTNRSTKLRNTKASDVSSDEAETDEDEIEYQKQFAEYDIPDNFVQITKLFRYAKEANQTGTALALLMVHDLITSEAEQIYIMRQKGIQLCVNLLLVQDQRNRVAALKVLKKLSFHHFIADEIIKIGGITILLEMIEDNYTGIHKTWQNQMQMRLTLEVMGNLVASRRARRIFFDYNGLELMIPFLLIDDNMHQMRKQTQSSRFDRLSRYSNINSKKTPSRREFHYIWKRSGETNHRNDSQKNIDLINLQLATVILWKCAEKKRNVDNMIKHDITNILMSIIDMKNKQTDTPMMGLICQCANKPSFQEEALEQNLIYHCIRCLKEKDNDSIKISALQTIGKCAKTFEVARNETFSLDGLAEITNVINSQSESYTVDVLKAALFAMRMLLYNNRVNCQWFYKEQCAEKILHLIKESRDTEVVVECFGIIKEFVSVNDKKYSEQLLDFRITKIFIDNLQHTDTSILVALNQALIAAGHVNILREHLIENDALRLVWSNLKSAQPKIVSSSANTIYSLIINPAEISEIARSFVGGLELLVKLLHSNDDEIITSICYVISRIAMDPENRTILNDYGILSVFVSICRTVNKDVKKALCTCLVSYGVNDTFRKTLQESIFYLSHWIESSDQILVEAAVKALLKLSFNNENCIIMFKLGVVKHLIELIQCDSEPLQEASAECLKNIRVAISKKRSSKHSK